jgi:hypothetical protein
MCCNSKYRYCGLMANIQFGHLPGNAVTLTSAATATALAHIVLLSATESNTKQTRTGL